MNRLEANRENIILQNGVGAIVVRDLKDILAEHIRGRDVLDIGCAGNISEKGHWPKSKTWLLDFVSKNSKYYVGLDIDSRELALIKNHLPMLDLVAMAGDHFHFNRQFDVVILNWVLSYLNPFQAVECAKRCVKPDGKIILGVTNMSSIVNIMRILRKKPPYPDKHFLFPFEPAGMINFLLSLDLQIVGAYWGERRKYSLLEKMIVTFNNSFRYYFVVIAAPQH